MKRQLGVGALHAQLFVQEGVRSKTQKKTRPSAHKPTQTHTQTHPPEKHTSARGGTCSREVQERSGWYGVSVSNKCMLPFIVDSSSSIRPRLRRSPSILMTEKPVPLLSGYQHCRSARAPRS